MRNFNKLFIGMCMLAWSLFAFPVAADIGAGSAGYTQSTIVAVVSDNDRTSMPAAHVPGAKAISTVNRSYPIVYLAAGVVPALVETMGEDDHYVSQIAEQPNKPPIMG